MIVGRLSVPDLNFDFAASGLQNYFAALRTRKILSFPEGYEHRQLADLGHGQLGHGKLRLGRDLAVEQIPAPAAYLNLARRECRVSRGLAMIAERRSGWMGPARWKRCPGEYWNLANFAEYFDRLA
jgi:hypothetical protein